MPSTVRSADFFSFLGLPRKLNIDARDLEQRYRSLSRQFHPDYFYNAPPAERRASLERTSYLNDAYRTLRSPIARIDYLLRLELSGPQAERAGSSGLDKAPPALLEEVFALNEELDDVRALRAAGAAEDEWKGRVERARQPIEAKRAEHEAQLEALSARWDALVDAGAGASDSGGASAANVSERRTVLNALRERVLERNYINNLLAGIEKELSA